MSRECENTVGSWGRRNARIPLGPRVMECERKGREGKGRKGEMGGRENIRKINGKNGVK